MIFHLTGDLRIVGKFGNKREESGETKNRDLDLSCFILKG